MDGGVDEGGEAEDGKWTSFTFRLATFHDPLTESIPARFCRLNNPLNESNARPKNTETRPI